MTAWKVDYATMKDRMLGRVFLHFSMMPATAKHPRWITPPSATRLASILKIPELQLN
jgi:hypothetical protein